MITDMQLRTAANGTAWKTATMRGYLFKTVLDAEIYGAGAYTLTFREAANYNSQPVDYVFYFNVDATVLAAYNAEHSTSYTANDATTLVLAKELLLHILNSQWQQGKKDDFELVRDGTGRTW